MGLEGDEGNFELKLAQAVYVCVQKEFLDKSWFGRLFIGGLCKEAKEQCRCIIASLHPQLSGGQ